VKILQVGKYYYPFRGGIETVVENLCEGLHARGFDLKVLCSSEKRTGRLAHVKSGYEIIKAPLYGTLFSQPLNLSMPFLYNELYKDVDIVHFHSPNPLAELIGLLMPKRSPMVVTYHADVIRQKLLIPFYRPLISAFLRKVDAIIVPTENHIKYSPVLTKYAHKCHVIPFGILPDRFAMGPDVGQHKNNIMRQYGNFMLFVGRLVSYKGLSFLIKAMKEVSCNLVIVGDGELKAELKQMASELGISERIFFMGKIEDEKLLVALFHACQGVVLPSVTSAENFGLVQIEAMACKKPVITTNIKSGVPLVGVPGVTSFLVNPEDHLALSVAIKQLSGNTDLASKMGEAGYKRFNQHFTRDAMIEKHLDLYYALTGQTQVPLKKVA